MRVHSKQKMFKDYDFKPASAVCNQLFFSFFSLSLFAVLLILPAAARASELLQQVKPRYRNPTTP